MHTSTGYETTVRIQRITEYFCSTNSDADLPRPKRQKTEKTPKISDNGDVEVEFPEARNKSTLVYSRPEAVTIIADATKPNTVARGGMMRAMIKKRWEPTSPHTFASPV